MEILTFPCNQFLRQEPGGAEGIETCSMTSSYSPTRSPRKGRKFNFFEKVHVYRFLRQKSTADVIPWNFCMFLVDRTGTTVKRFGASRTPGSITSELEEMLGGPTDVVTPASSAICAAD